MPEQLQNIINRIVEWWKKFNNKQRAMLISIAAVVILALAILGVVVSQPDYVTIYTASTMKEASKIKDLLTDNNISFNTVSAGMTFQVDKKDEATTSYLLATNDYPSLAYSIENVTSGSFTTTESDRQKLWQDFLEKKFADHLAQFNFIKAATVDITLPKNDGTILSREEQATAAVQITTTDNISADQLYGIAKFIATELGNSTTEGVTIINQDASVLYSGADESSTFGVASSQYSNTQKMAAGIKEDVKRVLMQTGLFSDIQVATMLAVDYSERSTAIHEYYGKDPESNTNMISEIKEYAAESNGGSEAIPGTDSNDDTTYYIDDNGNVYYTVTDSDIVYQNNEKITQENLSGGVVDYDNTSISVVANRYLTYSEEILEAAGELDEISWEEYKAAHSEPAESVVDESLISVVANATGISANRITFVCYEQPLFVDKETVTRSWSDILQIILAVLIFAMLGYVVFRSTRKQEETEVEPEISVEMLLDTTAEEQSMLDDIGYSEKSETRILIEKFVDENPDAVALLLRNWLNEDWD